MDLLPKRAPNKPSKDYGHELAHAHRGSPASCIQLIRRESQSSGYYLYQGVINERFSMTTPPRINSLRLCSSDHTRMTMPPGTLPGASCAVHPYGPKPPPTNTWKQRASTSYDAVTDHTQQPSFHKRSSKLYWLHSL